MEPWNAHNEIRHSNPGLATDPGFSPELIQPSLQQHLSSESVKHAPSDNFGFSGNFHNLDDFGDLTSPVGGVIHDQGFSNFGDDRRPNHPDQNAEDVPLPDSSEYWPCDQCGEAFPDANSLDLHASATSHNAFRCQLEGCDCVFASLGLLRDHYDEHDNGPKISCVFCGIKIRESLLRLHYTTIHEAMPGPPGSDSQVYYCRHQDCPAFESYYFEKQHAYYKHLRDNHHEMLFVCDYPGCDRIKRRGFIREPELFVHQLTHISNTTQFFRDKVDLVATVTSFISAISRSISATMAKRLRPPHGMRRIFWSCPSCKTHLFDDFIELQEGSLAELERQLNSNVPVLGQTAITAEIPEHTVNSLGSTSASPTSRSIGTSVSQTPRNRGAPLEITTPLPVEEVSNLAARRVMETQKLIYLLCCFPQSKYGAYLFQERLAKITTDRALFEFLSAFSNQRRYHWNFTNPFRTIQGLKIVKFLVSMSNLVDIQNHDRACADEDCVCLPPPEKVEPNPTAEYHCLPVPARHSPPIGENYLSHAFLKPSCIHPRDMWVYSQVPKRTSGKLRGECHTAVEGWGVSFCEDWDWPAIWSVLFCFFLLPSFLFLLFWTFFKGDIQGASGVAGYGAAGGTLFLGFAATRF